MSHLNLELEQLEERVAPTGLAIGIGVVIGIGLNLGGHGKCENSCERRDPCEQQEPRCNDWKGN